MYCSHCGKKVADMMLFCPFCGEPIVIPEQDDDVGQDAPENAPSDANTASEADIGPAVTEQPVVEPILPAQLDPEAQSDLPEEPTADPAGNEQPDDAAAELLKWSRERRSFAGEEEEKEAPVEAFSPLRLEHDEEDESGDWRAEIERRKQDAAPEKKPPQTHRSGGQTAHLDGHAPRLEEKRDRKSPARRSSNTFVPTKAMDPKDLFMDAKPDAIDRYDDYDAYDAVEDDYDAGNGYLYEDEEKGSFFMRHIRGIVGITLFGVLVLLFVLYIFSDSGQRSLASANLAWRTDIYSSLGYQSYQAEQYNQAGLYYERALARDPDNYNFASSAAMAYVTGNNTEKAAAMLKKCIEIDPGRVEPYVYLLNLYPEAAKRPWDVTQLIQKGYETTGDSRLVITG